MPRAVQEFAWQTIEARCHSPQYQLWERSFWAYDARARRVDGAMVYTLKILSEVPWQKSEPPAFIEMTIVDDGGVRLTALHSVFVTCAP